MAVAGADSTPAPVLPILIAMVAGAFVGWLIGPDGALGPVKLLPFLDLVGTLFINLLKMIIVPLIMASVITGVAALGSGPDLGRLGGKTLAFYVITTLIAVMIALAIVNIVQPGFEDGAPVGDKLALTRDAASVAEGVKARADASVLETIKGTARSRAESEIDALQKRLNQIAGDMQASGRDSLRAVEGQIGERPLVSVAIAFAVGLVLGKLFDRR